MDFISLTGLVEDSVSREQIERCCNRYRWAAPCIWIDRESTPVAGSCYAAESARPDQSFLPFPKNPICELKLSALSFQLLSTQ